jgi:putative SOS response-associated peptidase YedK
MCGRYFIEIEEIELQQIVAEAERMSKNEPEQITFAGGEIFPSNIVPVISNAGARFMKWGFPSLAPDRPPLINARSETALTTRTFCDAMQHRRCLVPATSYFEWQKIGKKYKDKYEFTLSKREPFFMAGVFTPRKEFAILTREVTPEIMPIHNRMPVIIPRPYMHEWLHGTSAILDRALTNLYTRQADTAGAKQMSFLM